MAFVEQETEGIIEIDFIWIKLALFDQYIHCLSQFVWLAQCLAHGKHDLYADVFGDGLGEYPLTGTLVQDIEPDHDHIPNIVMLQGML